MSRLIERLAGKGARHFPLDGDVVVTVGRSPANTVVITDPASSRKHCVIKTHGNVARLVDMGSANGTLVNGERVRERDLASGDVIRIGKTELVFEG